MNDAIKSEVTNLMMYDNFTNMGKQLNVLNKTNKLLNNDNFCALLKKNLDLFFNHPAGVELSDMGGIILSMRKIIPEFEKVLNLYHDLEIDSMKYILYGCLYSYIIKYNSNFLQNNFGQFRTEYDNIFNLIKMTKTEYEVENKLFKRIWTWLINTISCSNDINIKK